MEENGGLSPDWESWMTKYGSGRQRSGLSVTRYIHSELMAAI